MRVHDVHSRELAVASDRAGAVLDQLGSERDASWPGDRWQTTRCQLDGPLEAGTTARKGPIRHTVQDYASPT